MKFLNNIGNKTLKNFLEWASALIVVLAVFFLVRQFLFVNTSIYGDSMEPALSHQDQILVNRAAYIFSAPKFGDIVVFPYSSNPEKIYVKRIIGLPGDIIDLIGDGFYINGEPLNDEFSGEPIAAFGNITFPVTVPDNSYFVLGDNRNMSEDSRFKEVGFVKKEDILGKPFFRFFPFGKLGFLR